MLDNQSRMRAMLNLIESVDQGKKINLNEGMPSDVIKLKQKLNSMTPDQLLSRFEEVSKSTGKSVEELARSMAWRHGYGQNSSHYWNTIQRAQRNGDKEVSEGIGGALTGGAIGSMVGGLPGAAIGGWLGDKVTGDDKEVSEGSDENLDAETLADAALNAAALSIQDALGIETGDVAGMFFSGTKYEQIMDLLREYAELEIKLKDHEGNDSQTLDEGAMKRMLEKRAENMSKQDFVHNADEFGMSSEEAVEFWTAVNGEDDELNEAASRKDFRQVADIIKEIPDETKRKELANHHCEIFKKQNPRFSREKFMKYIGLADSALNESGGNTVQVTFVNSGYGITGDEKPQTVEKLGMDIDQSGRPILFIKSPSYGDKMQADWDAKNNRWIVDQD